MKFRKTVAGISALSMIISCNALTAMTATAADSEDYRTTQIKAYLYSYDNVKDIECRYYDDMPNVPYIKLSDYYNCWVDQDLEIINNNDGTYEVKMPIGATGIIDINKETVYSDDIVSFIYPQYIVEGDTSSIDTYVKAEVDAGSPIELTYDFSNYNIDLRGDDRDIWCPAPTLCDLYTFSLNQASYIDNALYFCGHPLSEFSRMNIVSTLDHVNNFFDEYKDGRPKDIAEYNYNELCFAFDNQYGFPGRITYNDLLKETNFDTMLSTANESTKKLKEMLLSENVYEYCAAFSMLNNYFWDGGHTSFSYLTYYDESLMEQVNNVSQYSIPLEELEGAFDYLTDYSISDSTYRSAKAARKIMYDNADTREATETFFNDDEEAAGYAFYTKGDTAVFSFDSFLSDSENWLNYYYSEGELPDDLVSNFYRCIVMADKDPNIRNFVIDLGANGGGSVDIVEYMMGLLNDIDYITVYSSDEGTVNSYFTADKNLDKAYDEKDKEFKLDLNIGIITSKYSFSCGNLMPSLAKEAGYMIVGETSGGGTCAVNFCTTADGLFYSISTGTKFVDSEGNDIDNGIEPNYELVKLDEEGEKDFSDVYNFDNLSKLFKEYYKLDDDPEPETTTDIASPTTETSTVSTENTTQEESYFAPVGQMGDYAKADYKSKTGKDATETVLKDNCDGTFSIILSDDKGNVLDTYTIDPATGKGKDSKGNNVDLPQTGINSMKKVAAAAVAVSFMTIGAGLVYVSGVGRKKKDNSKTT